MSVEVIIHVASKSVTMLIFLVYFYLINKAMKLDVCQSLCKVVGNHLVSWNIKKFNSSCSYLITDVVVLDINILCSKVKDKIVC